MSMSPPDREPLLRRIVEALAADERVAGAWLTGSIGRGEDDAWSDLDLHVAIYDESVADFWSHRAALYAQVGRVVLVQDEMPSNAQPGGHFQLVIFDGPLEVDWNVGPLSGARRAVAHVLLCLRDDVPVVTDPHALSAEDLRARCQQRLLFGWAMAPIAVKYIARGDTRRAVEQLGLVRAAFIDLWRMLEARRAAVSGQNAPLEVEPRTLLPRLGPTIDPPSCLVALEQLCREMQRLHPRLAAVGVAAPDEMPAQLARLVAAIPRSGF